MQEALQMSSKGYSPLDILKHFFGKGLNLQEADLPSSMLENPGASGEGIKRIRSCLNDLRISYPSIPEIKPENGKFGDDTKEAIAEFQRIFRLTVSGVLTPATQSQLGVVGESLRSLKRLLKERSSLKLEEPPDDKLSYGMDPAAQSGSVLILHHILNFLSLFNPAIPGVSEDIFGYETEESVAAFQRAFKISEAGAVGEATWPKLFEEYSSLQDSILDLGEEPDIPAFPDLQAKPDLPHEDQSAANQGGLQDKAQEQIMLDPAAPVGKPTPAAKSIGNSHEIRPPNISAKQRQYIDSVLYPGSAGFLKELGKAEQAEKPETAAPKPKLAFAPKSQAITLLLLFLLVNSRGNSAFSQNSAKRP
jgi:peptidoglycan hydrolase-like protein with peptidoglycan-binding domain